MSPKKSTLIYETPSGQHACRCICPISCRRDVEETPKCAHICFPIWSVWILTHSPLSGLELEGVHGFFHLDTRYLLHTDYLGKWSPSMGHATFYSPLIGLYCAKTIRFGEVWQRDENSEEEGLIYHKIEKAVWTILGNQIVYQTTSGICQARRTLWFPEIVYPAFSIFARFCGLRLLTASRVSI